MPGSEPGSWEHTRHHPSPRILYSILLWDSLWHGKPLGENVKNIVIYDYCALSSPSAYLDPHPLAIRIPYLAPII